MQQQFARGKLMWASFLTLVASGAGFATRAALGGTWEREFGIGGSQFGGIMGAGFLGFGMMIFFGGILVEKFGYKKLLLLAFVMHLISAGMLFLADPLFAGWKESAPDDATNNVYWLLYSSVFLFSICQGLYEAVINPLIAQLYPDNQTHYLNILHAGWPAGMILGGLFAACFIGRDHWVTELPWAISLASFAVFVIAYGILAIPEKFPDTVGEKSTEGFGVVFSCFASLPFLILIVLHGLIGYMELGVDSWISKLMENLMPNAILVLVYTSMLMFILRFFAGPIVHKINPIGLLFVSSVIACLGLLWLSSPIDSTAMIFVAATFYSFGKAFLWPTMLGVAGERYPKSGSVSMGALGAAGMLTVGLAANPRIGAQQGYHMSEDLKAASVETFDRYTEAKPVTKWGFEYRPVVGEKLNAANRVKMEDGKVTDTSSISGAKLISDADKKAMIDSAAKDVPVVKAANVSGGRTTLKHTAWFPAAMAIGFLGLLLYYRASGGYKVIQLNDDESAGADSH